MNISAIHRGSFRATSYKKYKEKQNKNPSTIHAEKFVKPDPNTVSGMKDPKDTNYEKLNEKGFVPKETPLVNGDAIIGKISPVLMNIKSSDKSKPMRKNVKPFKDSSVIYKASIPATVDEVYHGVQNNEGYETQSV